MRFYALKKASGGQAMESMERRFSFARGVG